MTQPASSPDLADFLTKLVPFVRTLQIEYRQISPQRAVVVLPDRPETHNHLAGPHAGAIFTAGETASGAVVLAAFYDHLDVLTPVTARSEISYRRRAVGPVYAEATAVRPAAEILAALEAGGRPEFPVTVSFHTEDGTDTGQMTVVWVLLSNR